MSAFGLLSLGSIEAVRPVFLIIMGVFLMLIAWRLSKTPGVWTARILVAGALLLGFGYAIMMPLYEAGLLEGFSRSGRYHGSGASAVAWHVVKLVVMNSGWLLFGTGIAMHAKILTHPAPLPQGQPHTQTRKIPPHESIA